MPDDLNSSAEFDVDQALSNIETHGSAEGEGAPTQETVIETPAQTAPAAAAPQVSEIEFTANGRQIKVPYGDARLSQWASQGYNYSQQMALFKKEQDRFSQERQQIEAIKSKYAPVDEYYAKNPDKWQKVLESFETEQNGGLDPSHPIAQELKVLKETLSSQGKFIESVQGEREQQRVQQEDKTLDGEIKSIRDQYPNLDWDTPDPMSGKSLELQVLEYASKEGIRKFTTAFRDFNHDKLVKYHADQAKEQVIKNRQTAAKSGIIGQTQSPTKGITSQNIKQKSYDELEREALQELGIN